MLHAQAQSYLNSFINYERNLAELKQANIKLDRMHRLMEQLSDPQRKFRCLHVAGTKGKGSTCHFIAFLLRAAGFRVGLYTSPHLHDVRERIRILQPNSSPVDPHSVEGCISTEAFERCLRQELYPHLENWRETELGTLSYFEVLTALAFYYFYQQRVDFAVFETGLGGRLDATNVVHAEVCGITPIGLEHTEQLGDTLGAIAQEKAAIIKDATQRVVIAPQTQEALSVIQDHCDQVGAKYFTVGENIRFLINASAKSENSFSFYQGDQQYSDLTIPLAGEHQVLNAVTALGMIQALNLNEQGFRQESIQEGLRQTFIAGRFEKLSLDGQEVILDCAHTPESIQMLLKTFESLYGRTPGIFLLGFSKDKRIEAMCRLIAPFAKRVIWTKAAHPRAAHLPTEQLKIFFQGSIVQSTENSEQALAQAISNCGRDDRIVVTGSMYLVGEVREKILTSCKSQVASLKKKNA